MELNCCSSVIPLEREQFSLKIDCQKPFDDKYEKLELNSKRQKQTTYKNSSRAVRAFEVLNSLREDEVLCDIKLETDDGTKVYGHKVILASATPYFRVMFTNFEERKKNHVILHEINSTALKFLVDFIYTTKITITEDNVQDLLHAANLLQLDDVKEACCNFLELILNPTNCLGFRALVSFYDCEESLSSFESYIRQNFSKVIENDEFLRLPYEQVVELISCDTLNIPSEEKVFECVISWMNHNSDCKNDVLLKLLEHVRLPLTSKEYLLNTVEKEPLLKNSLECKDYIIEALNYNLLKNENPNIIPETIRTKPRQYFKSNKNILVICFKDTLIYTEWYDPVTKKWKLGPKKYIYQPHMVKQSKCIALNHGLFYFSYYVSYNLYHYFTLDLFSQSSELKIIGSRGRSSQGIGVIDNCIYTVGGCSNQCSNHKDVEFFNCSTQTWNMISKMSTGRHSLGVGFLNNHLYAIGGVVNYNTVNSVERYCPTSCTWIPVANLRKRRCNVGVGILNGVIYVVGGKENAQENTQKLKSVEAYSPSSNSWTYVSDMHKDRLNPDVVALDGLLYVVGGDFENSVEIYNPKTNMWSMLSAKINNTRTSIIGALAIEIPPDFNT